MKKTFFTLTLIFTFLFTSSSFGINSKVDITLADNTTYELKKTGNETFNLSAFLFFKDCGSLSYNVFAVYNGHGYSFDHSLDKAESAYLECNNGSSDGWAKVKKKITDRWG